MTDSSEITRFGEKLRALRKSRGYTMHALIAELGYSSHGWISEMENGKRQPSIDFVVRVARFFDVTTDQLLLDELEVDGDI